MVSDLWDDALVEGRSEPSLLLYRSHLLGSDLGVTNFGGGNTSAKILVEDPLTGDKVNVLWVKGSGGDLASMDLEGFARLYHDKLVALEKRYPGRCHGSHPSSPPKTSCVIASLRRVAAIAITAFG